MRRVYADTLAVAAAPGLAAGGFALLALPIGLFGSAVLSPILVPALAVAGP